VIEQRWKVQLKDSRIYEILDEIGLSHQRGHRDYANAERPQQLKWIETVKKTSISAPNEKIVFFDEFAVYDRPSLFYGWAERNTRPQVPSDESVRHKLNGLLCIDAFSGEEFLRLSTQARVRMFRSILQSFVSIVLSWALPSCQSCSITTPRTSRK
jgi:hypothetical protein